MTRPNRFVTHWLAPLVLLVVVAGIAGVMLSLQNSWWADPTRAPSAEQRASDGSTVFTPGGTEYAAATGIVVVRLGENALPAGELGLDADGERRFDPDTPLQVRVLAPDGALVLDLMDAVTVTTADGAITRVELTPWGSPTFRDVTTLLLSRADTVGWTADDIAALEADLGQAARDREGDTYSARLAAGTALGVAVSAEVTVDLANSYTGFAIIVDRDLG